MAAFQKTLRRLAVWLFWPALALVVWGELRPDDGDIEFVIWDKLLHFTAYFGLAGISTVALKAERKAVFAIIALITVGAALEIVQSMVGRDGDIYDEFANTLGALSGGAAGWLFLAVLRRLLPGGEQPRFSAQSADRGSMFEEFKKFAIRGNVIDLAIGVIIGAAFTGIVNSLVKDIFTPPLGWMLGGLEFSNFFLTLKGGHFDTLAEAQKAGAITINYGVFLNASINFLFVAIAMFIVVRGVNRLRSRTAVEPPGPPPEDTVLLREIRDLLAKQP